MEKSPKICFACGEGHCQIGDLCRMCQDERHDRLNCGWEKQERQREVFDRRYFG